MAHSDKLDIVKKMIFFFNKVVSTLAQACCYNIVQLTGQFFMVVDMSLGKTCIHCPLMEK